MKNKTHSPVDKGVVSLLHEHSHPSTFEPMLNPWARYQKGLKMIHLFPLVEGVCACGCGLQLPKRRSRWATDACNRTAYIHFAIVKGDGDVIRTELFDRDKGICAACGAFDEKWEADHILSVCEGGGATGLDNFQTLCPHCHYVKTQSLSQRDRILDEPRFEFGVYTDQDVLILGRKRLRWHAANVWTLYIRHNINKGAVLSTFVTTHWVITYLRYVTTKPTYEVKLNGPDLQDPSKLRGRELGELLLELDEGLHALISEEDPGLTRDVAFVSLVQIETGCVALKITPSDNTFPVVDRAFDTFTKAIDGDGIWELPERTLKCVHVFHAFTKRHRGDAEFTVIGEVKPRATLRSDAVFSEPAGNTIKGVTTIYGVIKRAGGEEPKVVVLLPNGKKLYCDVKQSIAEELAHRLYKTVALTGTATWNAKFQIVEFKISSYNTEFQDVPLSSAFDKLRKIIGAAWDKVEDPARELKRSRYSLE